MQVIEIIPLTILPQTAAQILSYYHDRPLPKGAVVEINLHNRKIKGVVVGSSPIEEEKITLKKSGFQVKRIISVISDESRVNDVQFKIALWISKNYFSPLGITLKSVLPPFLLKKTPDYSISSTKLKDSQKHSRPLFILTRPKDTLEKLAPYLEEQISDKRQILVLTPEKTSVDYFYEKLSLKYPAEKLHSGISSKDYRKIWNRVQNGDPTFVIGTRQSLFLPFQNIGLIVVDDYLHEFYKSDMTPKYNTPNLAEAVSRIYGCPIIFISTFLGVNDYYKYSLREVDLKNEKKDDGERNIKIVDTVSRIKDGDYSVLGNNLKVQLADILRRGGKVLIFSPRKGHSGILTCDNCGLSFKCPHCDTGLRVHRAVDMILVCHHCGYTSGFPRFCPNCNSYKLKPIGPAGSQKIYDYLINLRNQKEIPEAKILVLDSDSIKNEVEEEEVISEIKKDRPLVIIASQMIFSHRHQIKFNLAGILNFDSLMSSPDYNAAQNLWYSVEKILDFNPELTIVNTYHFNSEKFLALKGNYIQFYEEELKARKLLKYPPFFRIAKLTYKHKDQERASFAARFATEKIKASVTRTRFPGKIEVIDAYPAFISKEKDQYIYNIIIKFSNDIDNISSLLRYAPAGWNIDVDPRVII